MLHCDFETYCDVDVREVGAQRYARHPSCEVLMMSWCFDDEPVQLWLPDGPWDYGSIPKPVKYWLRAGRQFVAHNVEFELNIFRHVLGIDIQFEQCCDTAVLALMNGYPKSLAGAGAAMRLSVQKDKRGTLLIRKFCAPRKPTKANPKTRLYPEEALEDWEDFKGYCITDTETERAIWNALAA